MAIKIFLFFLSAPGGEKKQYPTAAAITVFTAGTVTGDKPRSFEEV